MNTDIKFQNITNLTTITTTLTGGHITDSTQPTNNDQLKKILSYAIPLSCVTIIVILLVVFGIYHRHWILDKWISLKRMRNTNPNFRHSVAIRRDSEFDSYNHEDDIHKRRTAINEEHSSKKDQKYHLTTIL